MTPTMKPLTNTSDSATIKEALEIERSFLAVLLKRSRDQHGNTGYHRKMSQIISVVRKYQFASITEVVEKINFQCAKLESDVYRMYNQKGEQGPAAAALRGECVEEKWCTEQQLISMDGASSSVVPPLSSFTEPIDTRNGTLCSHIQWLVALHKRGKFQEVTSRMHSTMHSIFLETSRGFFLPLLSVSAAALSRIHSIIMIFARHAILTLLQVRDKLLPIFHHITLHRQQAMMLPHNIARYVGENSATWSQFQSFIDCTCGLLSYDVDLPQYMEVTPLKYDSFLASCNNISGSNTHDQNKSDKCKTDTGVVALDSNSEKKQKVASYKDKKFQAERICDSVRLKNDLSIPNKKRNDNDEDVGENVHHQHQQQNDVTSKNQQSNQPNSSIKKTSSTTNYSLNAADVRQLDDPNSVILSSLLPHKRKEKMQREKRNDLEHDGAPSRQKKRKSSNRGTSVIDEIFTLSMPLPKEKKKKVLKH